jgi:hypothetical protein
MYAAKMGSEGAAMYDAACALRDAMVALEVAVDGGKDSLSMAAAAGAPWALCLLGRCDFVHVATLRGWPLQSPAALMASCPECGKEGTGLTADFERHPASVSPCQCSCS